MTDEVTVTDADEQAAYMLLTSAQESLHLAFANDGEQMAHSLIIDRLIEDAPMKIGAEIVARFMRPERARAARLEKALRKILLCGRNDNCMICGFKDKIARAALGEE